MRRNLLQPLICCFLVVIAGVASGQSRVVSGRHSAPIVREEPTEPSRWTLGVGSGVTMAGDLFQVVDDFTHPWVKPNGTEFSAERFEVTLDEDVVLSAEFAADITRTTRLRALMHWTEMDGTALANDSQTVTPIFWDRFSLFRLGLVLEQALSDSRLRPYVAAGVSYLVFGSTAVELDQSGLTPIVGGGLLYDMNQRLSFRFELLDSIRQIDSQQLVGTLLPEGTDLREKGPQHVVDATFGLVLRF